MNYQSLSDEEIIFLVRKDDNLALKEIVVRYGDYYNKVLKKINYVNNAFVNDEMKNVHLAFYNICKEFDSSKGSKFTSYIYNYVSWKSFKIFGHGRSEKKMMEQLSYQTLFSGDMANSNSLDIIKEEMQNFDHRTYYIFKKKFFPSGENPPTYKELGEDLNISQEWVRILLEKHYKILKNKLQNYEKINC